jgi:pimeloyl-ACP methyl ester carboxylesterase
MVERQIDQFSILTGNWPLIDDRETLIFIHGAGQCKEFWKFQIEGLTENFNTIAIDLPGHGKSSTQAFDTVKQYAEAIRHFMDIIKIKKPVLCGLSMGGAVVQQILIDYPGSVHAGIVINSGARLKVLPVIVETVQKDYKAYTEMVKGFALSSANRSEDIIGLIDAASDCTAESALNDFAACNGFDVMSQLYEIIDPVLVLTASDDLSTPPKYGNFLFNELQNAKLVNIEGAGHFSPIEKPDQINSVISDFLRAIT